LAKKLNVDTGDDDRVIRYMGADVDTGDA